MLSVTVDVVDYEHDDFGPGIWHLRLPGFQHVVAAMDWGREDGRLLVGRRVSGILYVDADVVEKVPAAEPALSITRVGREQNPSELCVRGKLLDYYKETDMPRSRIIQSLIPVYALVEDEVASRAVDIGDWIEATGNACFVPDDRD